MQVLAVLPFGFYVQRRFARITCYLRLNCLLQRTRLHFKWPTAERRHVLCFVVGGDRTHAARPEGAGYASLCYSKSKLLTVTHSGFNTAHFEAIDQINMNFIIIMKHKRHNLLSKCFLTSSAFESTRSLVLRTLNHRNMT
jgi:hypothetical protein